MKQEFAELISQNQDIIHKVCRLYCPKKDDRQDLFQDIVYQLWKSYASFKGESKFTTWMYRVALNTAITSYRKLKRQGFPTELDEKFMQIPDKQTDEDLDEKIKLLYQAIATLSDIEKAIIMLHLEDHSYQETAQILGITLTNVGVKINRIKKKLKDILSKKALWN